MWTLYLIRKNRCKGEPFFDEVATCLPSGKPLDYGCVIKYQQLSWRHHKRIMLGVWENPRFNKEIAA